MPTVTDQARKTADFGRDVATEASRQVTRSVQGALRDGALATVGAGDQLVRQLRTLSDRVRELDLRTEEGRRELEQRLEELREQAGSGLEQRFSHLRENAGAELEQLIARGREVVEGVSQSQAAERASGQTNVATSQVKAAVTSVRKVADASVGQAVQAVGSLRKAADAGAEQAEVAASQTKAAATSLSKAADETADVVSDAAERIGSREAEVPLEDLKFVELRELAKERDIEGRTGMNKAELIRALREQ